MKLAVDFAHLSFGKELPRLAMLGNHEKLRSDYRLYCTFEHVRKVER